MKLNNKFLLIITLFIILFFFNINKSYCYSDGRYEFDSTIVFNDDSQWNYNKAFLNEVLSDYPYFVAYIHYGGRDFDIPYLTFYCAKEPFVVYESCISVPPGDGFYVDFNQNDFYCSKGNNPYNSQPYTKLFNISKPLSASYNIVDVVSNEVVFRGAGGESGWGNELQNPWGSYNYDESGTGEGEFVDGDFEDSTDGGWLSKLIDWLRAPFKKLAQLLAKIYNFFSGIITRILAGFFDFFKTIFVPNPDNIIFDEVRDTLSNKFSFFSSFGSVLTEFSDSYNDVANEPNFSFNLPAFLGGATVNIIDLRFYNQYRSWIHNFIIAVSYFLFIKKIYHRLPSIIKGG